MLESEFKGWKKYGIILIFVFVSGFIGYLFSLGGEIVGVCGTILSGAVIYFIGTEIQRRKNHQILVDYDTLNNDTLVCILKEELRKLNNR
jgi:hypothetical protein